jgi:hypothetical protein
MTGRGYYDRSGKYHCPGSISRYGGWWTYAAGRPSNGIGIGLELPPGRAVAYNIIGAIWLTAGGVLAYRLGELALYLSALAALSAVALVVPAAVLMYLSKRRADRWMFWVQTARQTGVRTGAPAVRSQVVDSFTDSPADSAQAVRIPVADR